MSSPALSPRGSGRAFRSILGSLCVVIVAVGVFIVIKSEITIRGSIVVNLGSAQAPVGPLAADSAQAVKLVFGEYRDAAKNWSLAFHGNLLLAAFLSAFAGVILKFENLGHFEKWRKDVAAAAAALSAFLVTISASLDFQLKWQANRLAAAQVEALAYDVLNPTFDAQDAQAIRGALREIALQRNLQIVGEDSRRASEPKRHGEKSEEDGPREKTEKQKSPTSLGK